MSRLDDAFNAVPAGSAPAEDPDLELDDSVDDPEPTGKHGDDEDPSTKKEGRSVDNVRSELLRKLEKSQNEIMAEVRALREERQQYRPDPKPVPHTAQTLEDMSIADLEQMRTKVPEEQLAAFDRYLDQRRLDEKFEAKWTQEKQKESFARAEEEANEVAFKRWPQLHDKASEFYRVTDRILSRMGSIADNNPRAVLDAANEAGYELGLSPNTRPQITRREPGNLQTGRDTGKPVRRTDTEVDVTSEEHRKIQKRLENAMPGKKWDEATLKRIAKRAKEYQQVKDLFIRG